MLLEGSYSAWSEIFRDSRRTFSLILRKRPDLHLQLTRILHALTARFKDVGYCQGMNFVAGTVLLAVAAAQDPSVLRESPQELEDEDRSPVFGKEVVPDSFMAVIGEGSTSETEVVAFKICQRLFVRNHFILMYELGLNTRLTIWTFDKIVESVFPDLHKLITTDLQVSADFYASSWFLTLFSADLDIHSSIRIMDLFVAKGAKSLYRFGLACLESQRETIMDLDVRDPAEGLKTLRSAAVSAVKEHGIENIISRSLTEYKFVTNQLIADLQTAGRVHGGAKLVLYKNLDVGNQDQFSWLVVPIPPSGSGKGGDSSPSGAAFEAAWSKDQFSLRRPSLPEAKGLLDRIKMRRSSLTKAPVATIESPRSENDDSGTAGLTGRGNSMSPEKPKKGIKITGKAFKSFGKKLGSMLPGSKRGYSRSDKKISAATDD